jgi:hypothetical protein
MAVFADYDEYERSMLISQMSFEKSFGLSSVFIESTLMENGGVPESANPSTLIKEAIHVISCGYEEKTEWGKEVCILVLRYLHLKPHACLDDTSNASALFILVSFLFVRLAGSTVQLLRTF